MLGQPTHDQSVFPSDDARKLWKVAVGFPRMIVAVLVTLQLATIGCGEAGVRVPVFPVSGKVLFQGKPPAGGRVLLTPVGEGVSGVAPSGTVKQDGSYTITTYDPGDGAPPGDYVATIEWYRYDEKLGGIGANVIPNQYISPKTSPVKVSVKNGPMEIPPITIK